MALAPTQVFPCFGPPLKFALAATDSSAPCHGALAKAPDAAAKPVTNSSTTVDASNATELQILNERTRWPAAPINEGGASASPGLLRSGAALLARRGGPVAPAPTPAAALRGHV